MSIHEKKKKGEARVFLSEYRQLVKNEAVIKEQISDILFLIDQLKAEIKPSRSESEGKGRAEKYLKLQLDSYDELRLRHMMISSRKRMIKRVLRILGENERKVIEGFYFFAEGELAPEDLMERLSLEKSQIYRIKEEAEKKIGNYICFGREDDELAD